MAEWSRVVVLVRHPGRETLFHIRDGHLHFWFKQIHQGGFRRIAKQLRSVVRRIAILEQNEPGHYRFKGYCCNAL